MNTLDSSSNVRNNTNEPGLIVNGMDHSIFIMEGLGQSKEEKQDAQTLVTDLANNISLQPSRHSLELVELSSAGGILAVDNIQSRNNDGNDSVIAQNEEFGSVKVDGPEDEHNNKDSSVRVVYSFVPSHSKRKLEELLHQWSEWHAQHFNSTKDPADYVESGEETYFPALRVGSEKSPAVSFSMDVPDRKRQRKDSLIMNDCSSLYDRGYAVGLSFDEGMTEESIIDLREARRCFNCGSFNHPLKECPKPFNRATVNSARKEFSSKKNLQSGPRVVTRYYQDSPNGKFDGLKPGALSAETKKLLGIGEFDPPPWLNRMRELGYPPGYLDAEDKDQPSGIEIFGDVETQNVERRNERALEASNSQKKMIVDFPGINAPIPENADLKSWMAPLTPGPDYMQNQPDNIRWSHARGSMINRPFHGANSLIDHLESQSSHFGIGLSPPSPHFNNYPPRDLFNLSREQFGHPREPFSPHYGRAGDARSPLLHYNSL